MRFYWCVHYLQGEIAHAALGLIRMIRFYDYTRVHMYVTPKLTVKCVAYGSRYTLVKVFLSAIFDQLIIFFFISNSYTLIRKSFKSCFSFHKTVILLYVYDIMCIYIYISWHLYILMYVVLSLSWITSGFISHSLQVNFIIIDNRAGLWNVWIFKWTILLKCSGRFSSSFLNINYHCEYLYTFNVTNFDVVSITKFDCIIYRLYTLWGSHQNSLTAVIYYFLPLF